MATHDPQGRHSNSKTQNEAFMIQEGEVYKWTAYDTDEREAERFENDYWTTPEVSRGQIVMAKNSKSLETASGNCLLIVLYIAAEKSGILMHFGRDEELADGDAELIREVFDKFPELRDSPKIRFLSTNELLASFGKQVADLHQLFLEITVSPQMDDVILNPFRGKTMKENDCPMSCSVNFDTRTAVLTVRDYYGPEQKVVLK
jgi:hypothetical protein